MALKGKLETEIELKADAQKFYEVFKKQAHQVPNAAPDHIQAVSVHEGDWETHGSVKIWQYTVGKHLIYTTLLTFDFTHEFPASFSLFLYIKSMSENRAFISRKNLIFKFLKKCSFVKKKKKKFFNQTDPFLPNTTFYTLK
jgi:hypothetical protein